VAATLTATGAGIDPRRRIWDALRASPLVRAGGAVTAGLLDAPTLDALRDEALACGASAEMVYVAAPRDEDRRRGDPDRWLDMAAGGPVLQAFYRNPGILGLLSELTGICWTTSGGQGSYSYYRRPGHYLGLHRDIDECDLAIITCVQDDLPTRAGTSGMLCLYPGRTGERLSGIRRSASEGAILLRVPPGASLILLGGLIPHTLLPVAAGHTRIVAPLCYRAVG
jgi:hypothetical protein